MSSDEPKNEFETYVQHLAMMVAQGPYRGVLIMTPDEYGSESISVAVGLPDTVTASLLREHAADFDPPKKRLGAFS